MTGAVAPSHAKRRRAVIGWSIYDLANTIFYLLVVTIHFPDRIQARSGSESTIVWGFVPAMLLSALLAPGFGLELDRSGGAQRKTLGFTALCIGSTVALAAPLSSAWLLALFATALFAYEMACVSYNSLLPAVADPVVQGRVSGLGVALGYFGNVVALLALEASHFRERFGVAGVFVFTGVLFGLFVVPFALWVPEAAASRPGRAQWRDFVAAVVATGATLRAQLRRPAVGRFLVGTFLICDPINTILLQLGRFARSERGLQLDEHGRDHLFLGVNVAAILGGLLLGRISDRTSGRRVTLISVACVALGVLGSQYAPTFLGRTICMGVFGGVGVAGVWTATRHWLMAIVPKEEAGQAFGLYGLVLRASFASLLPFTVLVDSTGGYAPSLWLLVALLVVGGAVLWKVPARRA